MKKGTSRTLSDEEAMKSAKLQILYELEAMVWKHLKWLEELAGHNSGLSPDNVQIEVSYRELAVRLYETLERDPAELRYPGFLGASPLEADLGKFIERVEVPTTDLTVEELVAERLHRTRTENTN